MRIGLDGLPLVSLRTGVAHYTFELARALAVVAPEQYFALVSPHRYLRENRQNEGWDRHPENLELIEANVGFLGRRWWTIGLPAFLKRNSFDLFHGTNYDVPMTSPCPSVLTIHDLTMVLFSETQKKRWVLRARLRLPLMIRKARAIIVPTESVKRELLEQWDVDGKKLFVINEAPRKCFQPLPAEESAATRKRLNIEDGFLLFVGTIEPRKNLITLVRAFQEVLTKTSLRPQLVIAGRKGWLTKELFELVGAARLGDRIHFTGYLPDNDLRALYSSCAVFLFPSLYEGAGLPPLEGMACGAPVITSQIPAIAEMVGDGARLVPATDVQAWAKSIVELLTNREERDHFSRQGRRRAASFSWERAARETIEVYRKVIRDNSIRDPQ